MRILGIDPGYAVCGFGVVGAGVSAFLPLAFGAITTKAHTRFEDRLCEVYDDVCALIDRHAPGAVAVETLFFNSNQKTAVAVAEARGVILLAARKAMLPVFEYSPLQVKQAITGYGKATKRQVQAMTQRLLSLESVPKPDDAADALAIALCHAHAAKSRQFGKAKTRRQGMGYE